MMKWILSIFVLLTIIALFAFQEGVSEKVNAIKSIDIEANTDKRIAPTKNTTSDKQLTKILSNSFESINESHKAISEQTYIVGCEEEFNSLLDELSKSWELDIKMGLLENSTDPNEQLTYLIYADLNDEERLSKLINLDGGFPNKRLAHFEILRICRMSPQLEGCNEEVINRAVESERDNAAMWLEYMYLQLAKGDNDKVYWAIENFISSPHYKGFYFQNVALYLNSFERHDLSSYGDNIIFALGILAAKPTSGFSPLIEWCKKGLGLNPDKSNACLQLGGALVTQSETQIEALIGLALQEVIYGYEKNDEAIELLTKKSKDIQDSIPPALINSAVALSAFDDELAMLWINTAIEGGEKLAFEALIREAILRSKNKDYQPCRKP